MLLSTPAAAVQKDVMVVVPEISTDLPVAVARLVVAAEAIVVPCVDIASIAHTAVLAEVPPLAIGRIIIVSCFALRAV